MKILSDKKYDCLIIEIETLKEIRENDEMCIDMMADRINRLEEENKKLKEKLSEVTMIADDEKQSIEHILELEKENKRLREENEELKEYKSMYEWLC